MQNATTQIDAPAPGLYCYTPEIGEKQPAAVIEASLSHSGKHYFLRSAVALKGRGVRDLGEIKPGDRTNDRCNGWHSYKVTDAAFESIKARHAVSMECNL